MNVTLESLKAEVASLSQKIAAFEQQPQFPFTVEFPKLNAGEKYVGLIVSADGAKREHIILLPGEFEGKWQAAMDWATSAGGELPDRVEGALLFATMKDEFKPEWHWTQRASNSVYAWMQDFNSGHQGNDHKGATCRARAVRRLPI